MNSIISEARELYAQTAKDPAYKKSQIWNDQSGNHHDLLRIINTCETPEEVIEELRKTDMYAIRIHDQRTLELMMEWHKRNIFYGFSVKGLLTTPNLYKMAAYCESIFAHCGQPKTIVELGGGNGQFSYISKHALGMSLHVDIDIPESLYMAYVCTRHRFPEAKCQWLKNSLYERTNDPDFIFVPVGLEYILNDMEFDLFVNTASMGELPNEKIRYWMDFVQNRINVRHFYGFNRFLNTIHGNEVQGFSAGRKTENEASVLFDDQWEVLKWEVEPLKARCPYEDPKIARYLEIILARTDHPQICMDHEIGDLKMEDWWRYGNVDSLGTHRSNQLVNDFTMSGTLFKLWNMIRLGNKEAIPMILKYFEHIGRAGLQFEEEYFYRNLLNK